jgi:malonyl CoA-acyl carrier protein transacylase
VRVAAARGEIMQKICDGMDSGLMAIFAGRRLLPTTEEQKTLVGSIRTEVEKGENGIHLALDINPSKIIVGGLRADLLKLQQGLLEYKGEGIKTGVLRGASGAFHTPLMEEGADDLRHLISEEVVRDAVIPIVTNTRPQAEVITRRRDLVDECVALLTEPVYGRGMADFIHAQSPRVAYNIGRAKLVMDGVEGDSRFPIPEPLHSKKLLKIAGSAAALGVGAVTAYRMVKKHGESKEDKSQTNE